MLLCRWKKYVFTTHVSMIDARRRVEETVIKFLFNLPQHSKTIKY